MVCLFLKSRLLDLQLHDLSGEFIQLRRHGIELRLDHCAGFIHEVDSLIRKETIADITVGKGCRRYKRGIGDLYAMINLITVLQSTKDRNRILDCRLIDHNRLETTFQSRILLNIFPVLIQRRRTDTVQLTTGKHRL